MLGGDSTKSVFAQVTGPVVLWPVTQDEHGRTPGTQETARGRMLLHGNPGFSGAQTGSLIQDCCALTMDTAKGPPPGLSLHDTRHSWRRGSTVATVFQTRIKVRDEHSEPGFRRKADLGERCEAKGRVRGEQTLSWDIWLCWAPAATTLLNTGCPFSFSYTAQDLCSWPMK